MCDFSLITYLFFFAVNLDTKKSEKITVTARFSCTAKLSPDKARVRCAINGKYHCNLLGIEARSEISPYISCDDISTDKELGAGKYLIIAFFMFSLVLELFTKEYGMMKKLQ